MTTAYATAVDSRRYAPVTTDRLSGKFRPTRHLAERVLRVTIPGRDGRHYVAIHTPAELADLLASARELTDTERAVLAADFLRIRGETGLLRRWEEGKILGAPMDRYDPLLLASCPPTWTPASSHSFLVPLQQMIRSASACCTTLITVGGRSVIGVIEVGSTGGPAIGSPAFKSSMLMV